MAASTLNRTNITTTDDTGTPSAPNGDGTLFQNAWVQAFCNAIDALFSAPLATFGGKLRVEGAGLQVKGTAAPSVSAAGEGIIYFDSTLNRFMKSENASAYTAVGGVLDHSTTEQDVTGTTTETSVYSYAVPGATLGTTFTLRLTITGWIDMAGNTSENLNIRVKFGGTVIAAGSIPYTVPTVGAFRLVAYISANGATNSQRAVVTMQRPLAGQNIADGSFNVGVEGPVDLSALSTLAIDSTVSQTLQVTFQLSAGFANNHAKRWAALTELL